MSVALYVSLKETQKRWKYNSCKTLSIGFISGHYPFFRMLTLFKWLLYTVKKRFTIFPSPAGMSLTKLPLGRNNSVMTSLFPPRESLVVTSRLGTGNSRTFFYGVLYYILYKRSLFSAYKWLFSWLYTIHWCFLLADSVLYTCIYLRV